AEDGRRDFHVTGVQTCALPIWSGRRRPVARCPEDQLTCWLDRLAERDPAVHRHRDEQQGEVGERVLVELPGLRGDPVLADDRPRSEERRSGKERIVWWTPSS